MSNQLGLHHTSTYKRAATATLTTAWLSMDSVHKLKMLHAIGIFLDTHDANISVKIEYRVQGQPNWTTVLAAGTGQRIIVQDLAIEFYQLQLRYTLTNAGNATQIAIAAISAQYSMDA